jgi:hypothetical protein
MRSRMGFQPKLTDLQIPGSQTVGIRGWVYVLSNQAMPGLVKVGYSTKDPQLRIEELAGTGLPHPFLLEYDVLIVEPRDIEQAVHSRLSTCHEAKEFFRCSVTDAIRAIQEVARARSEPIISEYRRPGSGTSARGAEKPYMRASEAICRVCKGTVQRNEYRCPRCLTFVM